MTSDFILARLARLAFLSCILGMVAGCGNRENPIQWSVYQDRLPAHITPNKVVTVKDKSTVFVIVEILQPGKQLQVDSWQGAKVQPEDFILRGSRNYPVGYDMTTDSRPGETEPNRLQLIFVTTAEDATTAQMDLLFRNNKVAQLNKELLTGPTR